MVCPFRFIENYGDDYKTFEQEYPECYGRSCPYYELVSNKCLKVIKELQADNHSVD